MRCGIKTFLSVFCLSSRIVNTISVYFNLNVREQFVLCYIYLCEVRAFVQNHWFKWMHVIQKLFDKSKTSLQQELISTIVCVWVFGSSTYVIYFVFIFILLYFIWVMYTYGFTFVLFEYFTSLSHWVICVILNTS